MNSRKQSPAGFTAMEFLIVLAIIGVLSMIVVLTIGDMSKRARDSKRLTVVATIGRFMTQGCYLPDAGTGDYDLADIFEEWKINNPEYVKLIVQLPFDPKTGSLSQTNYRYQVANEDHCVVYANLENERATVDLLFLDEPTPNSGRGVLRAAVGEYKNGWNGTNKYFQVSR